GRTRGARERSRRDRSNFKLGQGSQRRAPAGIGRGAWKVAQVHFSLLRARTRSDGQRRFGRPYELAKTSKGRQPKPFGLRPRTWEETSRDLRTFSLSGPRVAPSLSITARILFDLRSCLQPFAISLAVIRRPIAKPPLV